MYYLWPWYMRRISLLSVFEDTPVVHSFLVGGNNASTVGSLKNEKRTFLSYLSCYPKLGGRQCFTCTYPLIWAEQVLLHSHRDQFNLSIMKGRDIVKNVPASVILCFRAMRFMDIILNFIRSPLKKTGPAQDTVKVSKRESAAGETRIPQLHVCHGRLCFLAAVGLYNLRERPKTW
jgi:hypothetical protein